MPTYINTTDSDIRFRMVVIPAGEEIELGYYYKNLPDGLELTDDEPYCQPWVLLAEVADTTEDPINVVDYDNIIVYNSSDGTVTISANGDDDNGLVLMPNSREVYSNLIKEGDARLFGSISVLSNAGTGSTYIYGVR